MERRANGRNLMGHAWRRRSGSMCFPCLFCCSWIDDIFAAIHTKSVCLARPNRNRTREGRRSVSGASVPVLYIPPYLTLNLNSKFTSWNKSPDVQPGDPEFYSQQYYENGAKCWNGPHRSVVVSFPLLFINDFGLLNTQPTAGDDLRHGECYPFRS